MSQEQHAFQAEVARLLDIVAHSLYSNKEVFLRELISNASDACDKLRYAALTQSDLAQSDVELRITLTADKAARTLTVGDNGIGMNHDDLIENLGTIAHSGTASFLSKLGEEGADTTNLIGQFGVGFYSAFMVAEQVEVLSRKAGEDQVWRWQSDGKGSFSVEASDTDMPAGTRVIVTLQQDHTEFLEPPRLRRVVETYSDHIALPIILLDGEEEDRLNAASALWTRAKSEITEDQYREFYHHVAHAFDEPWLTIHNRQEGVIEYTNLLFIPSTPPLDLFDPTRRNRVKLYVRRVFISDDNADLLPPWLRFLRGIVDSEDLPLNISREMLQRNPVLAKIRTGLIKRVITALRDKAKDAAAYEAFWEGFGALMKEGLYEDGAYREDLLNLARFRNTADEGWMSLADYVAAMPEAQTEIYYLTGDDADAMRRSPQLEAFRKHGLNVLLLADPIDEFWVPTVGAFDDKPFRSVTRGDVNLTKFAPADPTDEQAGKDADTPDISSLTALFKLTLQDAVKDVRASHRLIDSPVCLVADEGDMDMHLQRMLRQHHQADEESKRILELNPQHPLIRRLADSIAASGTAEVGQDTLGDIAHLLLDQARIVEGEPLPDPQAFSQRLASALTKGLP